MGCAHLRTRAHFGPISQLTASTFAAADCAFPHPLPQTQHTHPAAQPLPPSHPQIELHPGGIVIDVGANTGIFSIFAAGAVGPKGRVLALEPSPVTAACAEYNVVSHAAWAAKNGGGKPAPVEVLQVRSVRVRVWCVPCVVSLSSQVAAFNPATLALALRPDLCTSHSTQTLQSQMACGDGSVDHLTLVEYDALSVLNTVVPDNAGTHAILKVRLRGVLCCAVLCCAVLCCAVLRCAV